MRATVALLPPLLLLCALMSTADNSNDPLPSFPRTFNSTIEFTDVTGSVIHSRVFYDFSASRYRLDSYGIPTPPMLGLARLPEAITQRMLKLTANGNDEDGVYPPLGLYTFFFHYDKGQLLSIWPGDGKSTCLITDINPTTPPPLSLSNNAFLVGTSIINNRTCSHWRDEYLFLTTDMFFDVETKNPAMLTFGTDVYNFVDFMAGPQDITYFDPPADIQCRHE